ncbi:MAG: flavodoxin family protein [Deltaproteobacteria bacterium]|nr:flavodoxin family protein [Deltaproteobacteria bacterium]
MKTLGIYGSPRKGGNSDQLLDKALAGAAASGSEVSRIYVRDLDISGCIECGGCDETGQCVIKDAMQPVYPLLEESDIIFLSIPIFFYNLPAQTKALVDRTQSIWVKRTKMKSKDKQAKYEGGKGYLIAVGATRGQNLFEGTELTVKYFYDALDMSYERGIFYRRMENKTAVKGHPTALQDAFDLGREAASSPDP